MLMQMRFRVLIILIFTFASGGAFAEQCNNLPGNVIHNVNADWQAGSTPPPSWQAGSPSLLTDNSISDHWFYYWEGSTQVPVVFMFPSNYDLTGIDWRDHYGEGDIILKSNGQTTSFTTKRWPLAWHQHSWQVSNVDSVTLLTSSNDTKFSEIQFCGTPSSSDTTPPEPVQGLSATASCTSLDIDWQASQDFDDASNNSDLAAAYRVYIDNAFYAEVGATNIPFPALEDTSYTIGVSAIDAAGNESAQTLLTKTTPLCPIGGTCTPIPNVTAQWQAGSTPPAQWQGADPMLLVDGLIDENWHYYWENDGGAIPIVFNLPANSTISKVRWYDHYGDGSISLSSDTGNNITFSTDDWPLGWQAVDWSATNVSTVEMTTSSNDTKINELQFCSGDPTETADVSVSKSNGSAVYTAGDSTEYTIEVNNNGPDAANGTVVTDNLPTGLSNANWTCSAEGGAICPSLSNTGNINETILSFPAGGKLTYTLSAVITSNQSGALSNTVTATLAPGISDPHTNNNSSTDTDTQSGVSCTYNSETNFQDALPDECGVEPSDGFGVWTDPSSAAYVDNSFMGVDEAECIKIHDRFWTKAPNGKAYHTWHPAITTLQKHGKVCDFGHEHGYDPKLANSVAGIEITGITSQLHDHLHLFDDVFEYSGGYPPFGFTVDVANGARHEDHVGHKITVAHYRAGLGTSTSGGATQYDAGFECVWLSKIHQGSHSMDAFSNHLHEYFLTIRCLDGMNSAGNLNNTIGTEFSIKAVFTYGEPNQFKDMKTGLVHQYTDFVDPNGNDLHAAHQTSPIGFTPNNREFMSPAQFMEHKTLEEVAQIDLWTEHVKILVHPNSDNKIIISPYYIVNNPSRIINPQQFKFNPNGPDKISRTIDLCYDSSGAKITDYKYCSAAPSLLNELQGWKDPQSPFKGNYRAVNFKNVTVQFDQGTLFDSDFCTDAFGGNPSSVPCDLTTEIQQIANPFHNNWTYAGRCYQGFCGGVSGSIWSKDARGNFFSAESDGSGNYKAQGIGQEFVIDNRDPDDHGATNAQGDSIPDGVPDGANIRGQN